jgi:hypothetical protein
MNADSTRGIDIEFVTAPGIGSLLLENDLGSR